MEPTTEKNEQPQRTESTGADRRLNCRLLHNTAIKVVPIDSTRVQARETNNGEIIDIGLGGIKFQTNIRLENGHKVHVNLDLEKFGVVEHLGGTVVWGESIIPFFNGFGQDKQPSTQLAHQYGVKFDQTNLHQMQTLVSFLDSNLSSRHSRKLGINRRRYDYYQSFISQAKEKKAYYEPRTPESAPCPVVKIDGREIIQLCSNNSLGMSVDPRVVKAARESLEIFGTGCGGSRLVSGNLSIQKKLEQKLASFMGYEEAIVLMTGYMGNLGVIEALTNTYDLNRLPGKENIVGIFTDHENHKSIIHGCQLAAVKNSAVIRTYDHLNMSHLEEQLRTTHTSRKIIITEGVFSMRGDLAPLPEVVSLAKKYKALVYLDDAHAIGHLGKRGRGSIEHWGIKSVDIVLGTFSKAFGAAGGFLVAKADLCEFLRLQTNTYIFSSALPPATVGGVLESLNLIENEPSIREIFWENARYFRQAVAKKGFDTLGSQTHITPIFIGPDEKAIRIADRLFDKGIFIPAIRWPAVAPGQSILRCMVMAQHTKAQLDFVAEELAKLGRQEGII
ncbi:MAG: 8-amino-7-oxononanoate synthase [Elusimicrobia bacterium]|nr:8-amino-7-oxononanoate synthase [Elusimicrobiota bacterium]